MAHSDDDYPANPVLTRVLRGEEVESQHRGAWVLVDSAGTVLDGAGAWERPFFARSSVKSLQALPLVESGAADHFGFGTEELALAIASHDGEPIHTQVVERMLAAAGFGVEHLLCGPHRPTSRRAERALRETGLKPTGIHNNCSGKHAGFLALGAFLGADPATYIDPDGPVQRRVYEAVAAMCATEEVEIGTAVDGCSAPTFRMPLHRLATGLARIANPAGLASDRRRACERLTAAARAHPALVAGTKGRICTDILRITQGRLFPKIGAEAVYVVGVPGADRGLAVKADDGAARGFQALLLSLLRRFDLVADSEVDELAAWRGNPLVNWAGLEVGRIEVVA